MIEEEAVNLVELSGPDYVTGRAFEPLLAFGDRAGWAQDELLAGLELTEVQIRKRSARIAWDAYADYLGRFEAQMGGPAAISDLAVVLVPSFKPMAQFMGFFAGPELIYAVINRWGGPSMFPCIAQESGQVRDGVLEVCLRIPPQLHGCPTFFRITAEMFRQAPCLVGGQPTAVDEQISSHEAVYTIHIPPSTTFWARVARSFRAFFSGSAVLEELSSQHDRLFESHRALQSTHRDLQRSEENFRTLIEDTPEGVVVLRDGGIVYANTAMRALLDVEVGDLIDTPLAQYLADDESRAKVSAASAGEVASFEARLRRIDGAVVIGEVKCIAVEWSGKPSSVFIISDVTERNRVLERAMQLDRMIAVGTLAAGVAHEINNPMAYIHTNLEYAIEGLEQVQTGSKPSGGRRLGGVIEALQDSLNGANRVREIIRDMKSISRRAPGTLGPVDLVEVARSAINMASHEVRPSARLRTEFGSVPPVLGDAGRLAQVVLNLVVNAAQAMPADARDRSFITVRVLREADVGVIVVEDNGPGIDAIVRRRLFEPFFTTKEPGSGTGMGLWISRNIVDACGGTIDVESELGRGTRFRVELPYAEEASAVAPTVAADPSEVTEETVGTPRAPQRTQDVQRLLVIDDEPAIGRMMTRVLGADVVAFSDPHKALRHLQDDDDFDIVVCDSMMPGMNGADLRVRIKAEHPDLLERFVLVTSALPSTSDGDVVVHTKPTSRDGWRELLDQVGSTRGPQDQGAS